MGCGFPELREQKWELLVAFRMFHLNFLRLLYQFL